MKHIILASGSPRRKELLEQVNIPFEVRKSSCNEIITKTIPGEIVLELSSQKAEDVASSLNDSEKDDTLVIGADTIVASGDQVLGKPSDEDEAFTMLSSLSGNAHQVYTGVTLIHFSGGQKVTKSFYECTDVYFYDLSPEEIRGYIATGEPMDKAGAYGIQGLAAAFVQKIHGDYYNVVGLPIARLIREIKKLG